MEYLWYRPTIVTAIVTILITIRDTDFNSLFNEANRDLRVRTFPPTLSQTVN